MINTTGQRFTLKQGLSTGGRPTRNSLRNDIEFKAYEVHFFLFDLAKVSFNIFGDLKNTPSKQRTFQLTKSLQLDTMKLY